MRPTCDRLLTAARHSWLGASSVDALLFSLTQESQQHQTPPLTGRPFFNVQVRESLLVGLLDVDLVNQCQLFLTCSWLWKRGCRVRDIPWFRRRRMGSSRSGRLRSWRPRRGLILERKRQLEGRRERVLLRRRATATASVPPCDIRSFKDATLLCSFLAPLLVTHVINDHCKRENGKQIKKQKFKPLEISAPKGAAINISM